MAQKVIFLIVGAVYHGLMDTYDLLDQLRPTKHAASRITAQFILGLLIALLSFTAWAFNGTAPPGNSAMEVGMAGAGAAVSLEPSALIKNPAIGAEMPSTLGLNLALAVPNGRYQAFETGSQTTTGIFAMSQEPYRRSAGGLFLIPTAALNRRINDRWTWGLQMSGAGLGSELKGGDVTLGQGLPGLESHCRGPFGGGLPIAEDGSEGELCGYGKETTGMALTQVFLSLSFSYRAHERLLLGIAPFLAVQQIEISGMGAFKTFSVHPEKMTDHGPDYSNGLGFRLGALIKLHEKLDLGLGYQSASKQSSFKKYTGFFLDGRFDTTEVINIGLAFKATPNHLIALDAEQYRFAEVAALGNSSNLHEFANGCLLPRVLNNGIPLNGVLPINLPIPDVYVPLGAFAEESPENCFGGANSPGLGWKNVTVYKIGYHGQSGRLGWQLGYSTGGNPIADETPILNALGPAHPDDHIGIGVSWLWSNQLKLSSALSYGRLEKQIARNGLSNTPITFDLSSGLPQMGTDVSQDSEDQWMDTSAEAWQWQLSIVWNFAE